MDNQNRSNGTLDTALFCWGVALLFGAVVFAMLMMVADWTALQAVFGGGVAFLVMGILLTLTVGRPLTPLSDVSPAPTASTSARASTASSASSAPSTSSATSASAPSATSTSAASTAASPAAASASAVSEASSETASTSAPAAAETSASAEAATPAAAAATSSTAEAEAPATAAPTAAAAPSAEAAPQSAGTKPATLTAARDGKADDLKRIKGVGPKMEKMCNSLGFWHFDQIASWTEDEVAWVDQNLEGFKGRVSRDEWVSQAKLLAAGGETEFSKKVDGGDVY